GAYVPLDPAYPQERLDFMLADALAGVDRPLLLTAGPRLAGRFAGPAPALAGRLRVLRLDAPGEAEGLAGESAGDLPGGAGPENLAYVIYTSGSTGRPKGV